MSSTSTKKQVVEKLYESENFIVINKPFDMYINSDDEKETNTVTYHIASPDSHLSTSVNPLHFVQRLDYSTSGVLCIAKNKSSAANAGKLFEKRHAKKYYLAIVRGHVDFELGDVEYPVGIDASTAESSHKMLAVTSNSNMPSTPGVQYRKAHTRVLALEKGYYNQDPATVMLMKPITGRRHQLRVHSKSIGFTILGDYTYSGAVDTTPHRMFLHAIRLVLPLKEEPLDIHTAEPFFSSPELKASWKTSRSMHKFRSEPELLACCDILDKCYVIGVRYKLFTCTD